MTTMTPMQRLEAFWSGRRPDRIPLTIYGFFIGGSGGYDDPRWRKLFAQGLIPTIHTTAYKTFTDDTVTQRDDEYDKDGQHWRRHTIATPVGEIFSLHANGWQQKYMLGAAEDYKVMTYVAEHTRVEADYENFHSVQRKCQDYGVCMTFAGRTPLQIILVDWAGLEQFSMHLFDYEREMMGLYHAQLGVFEKMVNVIAAGPGMYVSVLENFTAETMGPARFAQMHIPVYKRLFPILQQAGKVVGTHYDGKVASCKELIADAPIDLIESLTPPPEGDLTIAQARAAWPDKLFWTNINVSNFELPPEKLRAELLQRVQDGAIDGTRFAFEISEDLPANWAKSIPIVLETLAE